MLNVRVGGVVFEGWPEDSDRCFLIGPDGWSGWDDGVDVRRESADRPGAHGAFDAPGYLGSRVMSLTGVILAPSQSDLAYMITRLKGVLAGGQRGRLSVEDELGTRWCDVRLGAQPKIEIRSGPMTEADFQIQFWSADPRTFGEVHSFSGSSVQAFQYGNFPATPVVTVEGPVTAPYTVASQGKSFTVTQSLSSSQTHRIDMATGWVTRNGSLQVGVVSSAQTFEIPPGQPVTVTGPASMTVSVADTYI